MNDIALLRQYEPVVHYTYGEHFFPCAVDEYLQRCSLWQLNKRGRRTCVAEAGSLSVDLLARQAEPAPGSTLYLRFVPEPLGPLDLQRWRGRPARPNFTAPGRFARVGLLSRIFSSLFNISLLVRGTVPGGTAAAAEMAYQSMCQTDPRHVYYGRIVRQGGYVILHYLFFFTMNDWRSSFHGVNDHEADWEQCFVYLVEGQEGTLEPRWVAFASHDYTGDDLRRRWDDPDLGLVDGRHPIIYAGAGSHASYFQRGEYLAGVEPAFLRPVKNAVLELRRFWVEKLSQGDSSQVDLEVNEFFSVAFVDYARGDGAAIGPGQERIWTPILMEGQSWIEEYRGLWGVDTEDPFGGERAPAGPKFNRDGSVRLAWYDPLAWAGLDKVTPPREMPDLLRERLAALAVERQEIAEKTEVQRRAVRNLELEVGALTQTDYLLHLSKGRTADLAKAQGGLQALSARLTAIDETQQATQQMLARVEDGDWGSPHAHLKHQHKPEPPMPAPSRLLDFWGAVSGAALILVLVLLPIYQPARWYVWMVVAVLLFLTVESALRGRLSQHLLNVIIFLAIVTSGILLWSHWRLALVGGLLLLVGIMMRDNLRELFRR